MSDRPVFNLKQNLVKKLDPTLKASYFGKMTYLLLIFMPKFQMSTPFLRGYPEILHTCSTCPSRGLASGGFSVFFPPPRTFDLRCSTVSKNKKLTKKRRKRQRKKRTGEVFATAQRKRVQNFPVWIEKTAWTFAGEYISVFFT